MWCKMGELGVGEIEKCEPTPTGSLKPVRNLEPLKGAKRCRWGQGTPVVGPSFCPLLWPLRLGPSCPWPILVCLLSVCSRGAEKQPGFWEFPPFHSYPQGLRQPTSQKYVRECHFPDSSWNYCGHVKFLSIKPHVKWIRASGYVQF